MSKYERFIIYPMLLAALFFSLTGVSVLQAGQEALQRIVTRELVIVDELGHEMVTLSTQPDDSTHEIKETTMLRFYDRNGNQTAAVGSVQNRWNEVSGTMYLGTDSGLEGVRLSSSTPLGGELRLFNPTGDQSAWLRSLQGGELTLYNHEGQRVNTFGPYLGNGSLAVFNEDGDTAIRLNAFSGGSINLYGPNGHWAVWLGAFDGGSLQLFDDQGDARATLSGTAAGDGRLWLYNRHGDRLEQPGF